MTNEYRGYNCPILEEWGIHWSQVGEGLLVCTEFCTRKKCVFDEPIIKQALVPTQINDLRRNRTNGEKSTAPKVPWRVHMSWERKHG